MKQFVELRSKLGQKTYYHDSNLNDFELFLPGGTDLTFPVSVSY